MPTLHRHGQPHDRAAQGGGPKPIHDPGFRPAFELKVMMQRGAEKQPSAPPLKVADLTNDAHGLRDENAADHYQHDFLPNRQCDES